MTPKAKKMQAVANAYAMARAVSCNPDMGAVVLARTLEKAGYKISKITWRDKELRQRAAEGDAPAIAEGVTL